MKRLVARALMTTADRARRCWWFLRRPQLHGVRGIAVTPEGKLVLIQHSYTRGWHFPGGGIRRGETPMQAALRELTEEIGLVSWTDVEEIGTFDHMLGYARDHVVVFALRDACFTGGRSIEVEAVNAFALSDLPADTTPEVKSWARRALKPSPIREGVQNDGRS